MGFGSHGTPLLYWIKSDVLLKASNKTSSRFHWGPRQVEQDNSNRGCKRLENPIVVLTVRICLGNAFGHMTRIFPLCISHGNVTVASNIYLHLDLSILLSLLVVYYYFYYQFHFYYYSYYCQPLPLCQVQSTFLFSSRIWHLQSPRMPRCWVKHLQPRCWVKYLQLSRWQLANPTLTCRRKSLARSLCKLSRSAEIRWVSCDGGESVLIYAKAGADEAHTYSTCGWCNWFYILYLLFYHILLQII